MEKKNHLNIFNASNKKEYCNKMEKMKKKNVKIKINIFIEMIYIYIYTKNIIILENINTIYVAYKHKNIRH